MNASLSSQGLIPSGRARARSRHIYGCQSDSSTRKDLDEQKKGRRPISTAPLSAETVASSATSFIGSVDMSVRTKEAVSGPVEARVPLCSSRSEVSGLPHSLRRAARQNLHDQQLACLRRSLHVHILLADTASSFVVCPDCATRAAIACAGAKRMDDAVERTSVVEPL